jgi:hypothetical protein
VDSIYFQNERTLCYQIAGEELKFYRQPIYGAEWDTVEDALEALFITISIDNIILLWEGLLLERKIFIVSSRNSLLHNVCMALTSLIFPFQWIHVLIPILPEKLKIFTDAPVPFMIGINFKLDLSEIPADSIVFNVDKNTFDKYLDKLPKLPIKLHQNMLKRLDKFKTKFSNQDDLSKVLYADEVFSYVGDNDNSKDKFNTQEIRDIFYEFFLLLFKNYEKYFGFKNRKTKDGKLEPLQFNRDYFLKDQNSLEQGSFIYKFTETNIFGVFEEGFKYFDSNYNLQFFIDSIKKEKKKDKYYLPIIIPTLATVVPELTSTSKDLLLKKYHYKYFPKLNPNLYVKIEMPKPVYQSKFEIARDEWCFDITKLTTKDWSRYLIYTIYDIWYQFFSIIIPTFDDKRASLLMDHSVYLLQDLIKKKITPSRSLYSKLIRACGRGALSTKVNLIFSTMPQNYRQNNPMYYNAFMNGLYDTDTGGENQNNYNSNNLNSMLTSNLPLKGKHSFNHNKNSIFNLESFSNSAKIEDLIETCIFLSYEYCPNCHKNKKLRKLSIEDLMGGFRREKSTYYSVCNVCLCKIFPKLYILNDNQEKIEEFETVNFISPIILLKEIDNLIKNHGEKYFYLTDYYVNKDHRQIFWNIIFYFQMLNLPCHVLYIQRNEIKLNQMAEQLEMMKISNNKKNNQNMNLSNARLNSLNSDLISRKQSSASNDVSSVFSGPTIKSTNLHSFEKTLNIKIIEKIETIMNNEMEKVHEDKSEIMNNIYEIRQLISKNIEEFNHRQKHKLDNLYKALEYNEELERLNNVRISYF